MNKPLIIEYYSDVLCVWAWIAQRRLDELNQKLGNQIEFRYFYVDIFGDVPTKIDTQWGQKGGYKGFAEHVQQSTEGFDHAPVSLNVWSKVKPATSANAHVMLKAIEITHDKSISIEMALKFRSAFFVDAMDIGNMGVLHNLIEGMGLKLNEVESSIQDGSAMAALMHDYQKSKQQGVKGSPSYVMDGGRQTLYGNVGYRVLQANIDELLKSPSDEASWC